MILHYVNSMAFYSKMEIEQIQEVRYQNSLATKNKVNLAHDKTEKLNSAKEYQIDTWPIEELERYFSSISIKDQSIKLNNHITINALQKLFQII